MTSGSKPGDEARRAWHTLLNHVLDIRNFIPMVDFFPLAAPLEKSGLFKAKYVPFNGPYEEEYSVDDVVYQANDG